ncbi:hypothetical protein CVD25_18715 [Bacillus canaveralius]|uniref:Uncharacterized protein n=1 Tax=Bacillus canaveralius TaxID=1403243 RepID=A0A2N5GIA4_9BACI|nr:hypothetical protein CU635_17960 [Bacillus canaveralius]PLR87737.1 hypothetical protein CVD23_00700 [Bacillus sp. V33-4]PLR92528.1 hypothetical protein CVD25_18715 [Bacillus canaveralius]
MEWNLRTTIHVINNVKPYHTEGNEGHKLMAHGSDSNAESLFCLIEKTRGGGEEMKFKSITYILVVL